MSLSLQEDSLSAEPQGSPLLLLTCLLFACYNICTCHSSHVFCFFFQPFFPLLLGFKDSIKRSSISQMLFSAMSSLLVSLWKVFFIYVTQEVGKWDNLLVNIPSLWVQMFHLIICIVLWKLPHKIPQIVWPQQQTLIFPCSSGGWKSNIKVPS